MEDSWEDWFSDLDLNGGDKLFNECHTNCCVNIEEQGRDMQRQQQPCGSETQSHYYSNVSSLKCVEPLGVSSCQPAAHKGIMSSEGKKVLTQGTKRGRSSWETHDHIMSERKRRQEMAQRFIALSAIIPGLNKIDKASILGAAINHVKQLKERVTVLEQEIRKRKSTTSFISIRKSQSQSNPHVLTHSSNAYCLESNANQVLCELDAICIESENEVLLIRIQCEKRSGIFLKLLALLDDMHLSVASSTVLPFGKTTLSITIIVQMGEEYVTEEELVNNLRGNLLKLNNMQL